MVCLTPNLSSAELKEGKGLPIRSLKLFCCILLDEVLVSIGRTARNQLADEARHEELYANNGNYQRYVEKGLIGYGSVLKVMGLCPNFTGNQPYGD